jgi:cytochrome b561
MTNHDGRSLYPGLVIARLRWRARHVPPPLPPDVDVFSLRLSTAVHWLLYALMLVIPIVGIITFIRHGRVFDFGLFRLNVGVRSNRAIFHPTEDIDEYLAYALFTLAGIHALAALWQLSGSSLAALWHNFIKHDTVLRRMWPSKLP